MSLKFIRCRHRIAIAFLNPCFNASFLYNLSQQHMLLRVTPPPQLVLAVNMAAELTKDPQIATPSDVISSVAWSPVDPDLVMMGCWNGVRREPFSCLVESH